MLFNKKFFLLIVSIASFKAVQSKVNIAVIESYKNQLKAEQNVLMADCLDSFGITSSEWYDFQSICENEFQDSEKKHKKLVQERCCQRISDRMKAIIVSVINKANLIRPIEVIPDALNDEYQVDVTTLRSLMIINEKRFNKMHPEEDQATAKLWHEIMHIYHDDSFTDFCLRDLKNKVANGSFYINWFNVGWLGDFIKKVRERFNETKWHIAYKKWTLFTERRADILSGLESPEMAHAWVAMLTNYVKRYTDFPGGDHPTGSERLAYMTKLRDDMLAG